MTTGMIKLFSRCSRVAMAAPQDIGLPPKVDEWDPVPRPMIFTTATMAPAAVRNDKTAYFAVLSFRA